MPRSLAQGLQSWEQFIEPDAGVGSCGWRICGERRAFDRDSGIDVVDAVIVSTAAFGSPPALLQGHPYVDAGYYASDNADMAIGFDRVMVLADAKTIAIPLGPAGRSMT